MAEITAATAVGWVVSPVISLVINKATTYIENTIFKKAGIEDEMKEMKTTLTEIHLFMGTFEKQKIKDQNHAELMRQTKDAVYDAEDIMDEFEYDLLKEKFEKQKKTLSAVASSSYRAIYQSVGGNQKFKKRVKEVSESLDRAKKSADNLINLMKVTVQREQTNVTSSENWHLTSPLISEEIVGRENECRLLIDLLLRQSDDSTSPPVISIVGQGGIGKTTLAQMVYNDSRLNDHFHKKIWLTVSDKFDMLSLTREILKLVCKNCPTVDTNQFGTLQTELENELESKKILLILDDVWYNKGDEKGYSSYRSEWLQFLAPLKKAEMGSKIVITTRDPTVERVLGTVGSSIPLDGLNEDDRWSLFELCAFGSENQDKRHELEPIGKEIVNKLKGLALAVRVVGTQLRGKSDVEEWNKTLNDNLLENGGIMKILHRSYEHLPEHLKRCFAYCSLFPKDYRLKPDRLVHMWIAQGFIHSEDRNKLEVGKSYFQTLLARSFFQVIKKNKKEYYVMHDLMSDLACHVSKGECHILDKDDSIRNLGSIRHLFVTYKAIDSLKNMQGLDKLHTLMLSHGHDWLAKDITNLFILLKRIRVLHIECEILNLCAIGQCKHLRYLSVRNPFDMMMVKSSLSKLYLLSALFIKKWRLMFPNEVMLPKFLRSTSCLISIKTMDMCVVLLPPQSLWKGGCASLCVRSNEMGHGLDLLGNVTDIKGNLVISGLENATCEKEAIKGELSKKQHVIGLDLSWENSSLKVESTKYHAVLKALSPNPNLRDLLIDGYPGAAWPSWLESNFLSSVKTIKLQRCMGIRMLPSLGQLPLLQDLRISNLTAVRIIGLEFYGNGKFSSLENLEIELLTSLEEWSYPCDSLVFPKLNKLKIKDCHMLKLDNDFVPPRYLEISSFDSLECISTLFQGDVSIFKRLTKLEVSCCPVLISLQDLHELASLRIFGISDCNKLLFLPEMELFYSLKVFAIINCPELRSFPKRGLPASLHILWIGGEVHQNLKEQIQSKKGCDWDKIAAISGCDLYSSIGHPDLYYLVHRHYSIDHGALHSVGHSVPQRFCNSSTVLRRFFDDKTFVKDYVYVRYLHLYKVDKNVRVQHATS